jgi:hypothetical protein
MPPAPRVAPIWYDYFPLNPKEKRQTTNKENLRAFAALPTKPLNKYQKTGFSPQRRKERKAASR